MHPQAVGLHQKLLGWDLLSPSLACAVCQGPVRFQDGDWEGQDRAHGQQAQPAETAAPAEPEQPVSRLDRLVIFLLVLCCKYCAGPPQVCAWCCSPCALLSSCMMLDVLGCLLYQSHSSQSHYHSLGRVMLILCNMQQQQLPGVGLPSFLTAGGLQKSTRIRSARPTCMLTAVLVLLRGCWSDTVNTTGSRVLLFGQYRAPVCRDMFFHSL